MMHRGRFFRRVVVKGWRKCPIVVKITRLRFTNVEEGRTQTHYRAFSKDAQDRKISVRSNSAWNALRLVLFQEGGIE